MAVVNRATLKAYFTTGTVIVTTAMADMIDSGINQVGTTAQAMNSDLTVPNLIATNVSAQTLGITGTLLASAATLTGRIRQGVSAATSAADSRGDCLVVQEATVAASATSQVAFLPTTSNIVRLAIKVLIASSVAAGGMVIRAGDAADGQRFGTITVSGVGLFDFSSVSAAAFTGVSGRVEMVSPTATAAANMIGIVQYYQRV